MTLNYECIVWTPYIEDMNRIIEQINFSEGAYWGEPNKFKFLSSIDSFEDAIRTCNSTDIDFLWLPDKGVILKFS